jgi:hypothetical protein
MYGSSEEIYFPSSVRAYFKVNSGFRSSFVYCLQHSLPVIPIFIASRPDVEMAVYHDLKMIVFVVSPMGAEWAFDRSSEITRMMLSTPPFRMSRKGFHQKKGVCAHLDPSVINLGSFCISILMFCKNW